MTLFYTRPNLPPLNLDLASIEGGGSHPAQFWGRTVDGRKLDIRYRVGHFSVGCGDLGAPGDAPTRTVIDAEIGPWLHGDMLLEQACDLAGLTVRGERLVLSEERRRLASEQAAILDWSGHTTYWIRDLWVTQQGGEKLFETLTASLPDLLILELWWDAGMKRRYRVREALSQCEDVVVFGIGADMARLDAVLASDYASLVELSDAFAYTIDFRFDWTRQKYPNVILPRFFDQLGSDVEMVDRRSGRIATKFTTADSKGKEFVQKVIAAADACFSNRIEAVDLFTGQVAYTTTHHVWHSLDLRAWCREKPGRFLGCFDEKIGESVRHLGIRPAE